MFGLCEGYHAKPGQRILTLQIEGKPLRTVDMVAEKGRNQPEVFSFPARDENGDGWIDLAVAAAENSPDKNAILNTLWVFGGEDVPAEGRIAGRPERAPAAGTCGLRRRLGIEPDRRATIWRSSGCAIPAPARRESRPP